LLKSEERKEGSYSTPPASGIHLSVTTLLFVVWVAYAFGGITIETILQVGRADWKDILNKEAQADGAVISSRSFDRVENSTVDDDGVERESAVNDSDAPWPRPAWLMSFPNSGTSFTSDLIYVASNSKRATNYGGRNLDKNGNSVPVLENDLDGPFWVDPQDEKSTYPTRYVITKTHCGGYCKGCPPDMYVNTPYSFLRQCLSGNRRQVASTGKSEEVRVTYSPEKIHRAIHLIRNPFDNIVSRFHLEQHEQLKHDGTEMSLTKEGFREYCRKLNKKVDSAEHSSKLWDTSIYHLLKDVPCHTDFFRYIQWHNLAFTVLNDFMQIPAYTLHYENFESRFNETAKEVMDFLELAQVQEFPEFVLGKQYEDYFEEDEKVRVKEALRSMASIETWQNIQHYFEGIEG